MNHGAPRRPITCPRCGDDAALERRRSFTRRRSATRRLDGPGTVEIWESWNRYHCADCDGTFALLDQTVRIARDDDGQEVPGGRQLVTDGGSAPGELDPAQTQLLAGEFAPPVSDDPPDGRVDADTVRAVVGEIEAEAVEQASAGLVPPMFKAGALAACAGVRQQLRLDQARDEEWDDDRELTADGGTQTAEGDDPTTVEYGVLMRYDPPWFGVEKVRYWTPEPVSRVEAVAIAREDHDGAVVLDDPSDVQTRETPAPENWGENDPRILPDGGTVKEIDVRSPVWDNLFAHPQSVTRGMMEKDTLYPVSHCIYARREDGKFERLCDSNFAGNYAPEVRDHKPKFAEPIGERWDDYSLLGEGYSCTDCARIARTLAQGIDETDGSLRTDCGPDPGGGDREIRTDGGVAVGPVGHDEYRFVVACKDCGVVDEVTMTHEEARTDTGPIPIEDDLARLHYERTGHTCPRLNYTNAPPDVREMLDGGEPDDIDWKRVLEWLNDA